MSNRERWVVYPLILFAFMLGARDTIIPREQIQCSTIACNQITVQSSDGKSAVRLTTTEDDAGLIVINGCRIEPELPGAVVPESSESRRPLGHQAIILSASGDGGFIRIKGTRPGSDLFAGHDREERFSGFTATDANGKPLTGTGPNSRHNEPAAIWGLVYPWGVVDKYKSNDSAENDANTTPLEDGSEQAVSNPDGDKPSE